MAKVELKAGASFDVLTQKELQQALDRLSMDWMAEVTRGVKFRRFLGSATVAAGAVSLAENVDNILGPGAGLTWAVNSLVIGGLASGDSVDVLINDSDPVDTFTRAAGSGNYVRKSFGQTDLVLNPSDYLTVVGTGLTAVGQIKLFGRCTEIPRTLTYKLI